MRNKLDKRFFFNFDSNGENTYSTINNKLCSRKDFKTQIKKFSINHTGRK